MKERLLTTEEAAKRLGVGRTRIWQLIRDGILPATKYGRAWLVLETDLCKQSVTQRAPKGRPRGRVKKEPDPDY